MWEGRGWGGAGAWGGAEWVGGGCIKLYWWLQDIMSFIHYCATASHASPRPRRPFPFLREGMGVPCPAAAGRTHPAARGEATLSSPAPASKGDPRALIPCSDGPNGLPDTRLIFIVVRPAVERTPEEYRVSRDGRQVGRAGGRAGGEGPAGRPTRRNPAHIKRGSCSWPGLASPRLPSRLLAPPLHDAAS